LGLNGAAGKAGAAKAAIARQSSQVSQPMQDGLVPSLDGILAVSSAAPVCMAQSGGMSSSDGADCVAATCCTAMLLAMDVAVQPRRGSRQIRNARNSKRMSK